MGGVRELDQKAEVVAYIFSVALIRDSAVELRYKEIMAPTTKE